MFKQSQGTNKINTRFVQHLEILSASKIAHTLLIIKKFKRAEL